MNISFSLISISSCQLLRPMVYFWILSKMVFPLRFQWVCCVYEIITLHLDQLPHREAFFVVGTLTSVERTGFFSHTWWLVKKSPCGKSSESCLCHYLETAADPKKVSAQVWSLSYLPCPSNSYAPQHNIPQSIFCHRGIWVNAVQQFAVQQVCPLTKFLKMLKRVYSEIHWYTLNPEIV